MNTQPRLKNSLSSRTEHDGIFCTSCIQLSQIMDLNCNCQLGYDQLLQIGQIVASFIGAILCVCGLCINPFWTYVYWSTVVISSILLALTYCNLMSSLESKCPCFINLRFGYVLVYAIVYLICTIWSFIDWEVSALLAYVLLVAFAGELFMRYWFQSGSASSDSVV